MLQQILFLPYIYNMYLNYCLSLIFSLVQSSVPICVIAFGMIEKVLLALSALFMISMGYFRKKYNQSGWWWQRWGGGGVGRSWDILFWKKQLESLDFSLLKKAFAPGNSAKLCDTPWKFQVRNQNWWKFYMNNPGNSSSFLIKPWNFHTCSFFNTSENSMSSTFPLPILLGYFL